MKRFWKKFFDIADDILAYVLTVVGILFSNILTLMSTNEAFTIDISALRVVGAMLIAFAFVGRQEYIAPDDKGDTSAARAGRKRNFKMRMSNALAQGFMWAQAMGKVFKQI